MKKEKILNMLPIIAILLLAAYLRIKGFFPGYPPYHSDEGITYSAALQMFNNRMDPGRYDYPALVPLLNLITFKFIFIPLYWIKFYILNFQHIVDGFIKIPLLDYDHERIFQLEILGERELNALAWSRLVTAFFGIATVGAIFVTAKKMFSKRIGLISAFLLSVNYRHVLNSHLGLPDIYNAFFLILALYFAYQLYKSPSSKNFIFAGITSGLSLAVKYQFFSFFPLILANLLLLKKNKKIKKLQLITPLIILLIFLLINPYLFIKFEQTKEWLWLVKAKYATGINRLDFYGYSYLYHVAIGRVTSVLICLGIILSLKHKVRKTSFFLLSIVVPFFYITTYFTGASFYTRNFVTIIPLLLIFSALFIDWLLSIKKIGLISGIILIALVTKESLVNSLVVVQEYSRSWNYELVSDWISENIPEGATVAAHSSVPFAQKSVDKIPLDLENIFSLEEARLAEADFVVVNLDWATNNYYWWMRQGTKHSLKYWKKPVEILKKSHSAMSVSEITEHTLYEQTNSWQAPESNFIVAKVPEFVSTKEDLIVEYDFQNNNSSGWIPDSDTTFLNLEAGEAGLPIVGKSTVNAYERWISPEIKVDNVTGFVVDYYRSFSLTNPEKRDGFIGVLGFDSYQNAQDLINPTFIRLGERWSIGSSNQGNLIGKIPENTNYLRLIFQVYDSTNGNFYLQQLKLYSAKLVYDYHGFKPFHFKLDDDILFPYSHGGL